MKHVTFPYMGTMVIYKKFIELLGHETICPPKPTKKTIDLGVKYSPEFACFPYKVLMGSYIEALELGAKTIITSGGFGPCRAGYYNQVHEKTLKSMGYEDVEVLVFEDPGRNFKQFYHNVMKIKGKNSWWKLVNVLLTIYELAHSIDELQKIVDTKRAYEVKKGSFSKAWEQIQYRFDQEAFTRKDVKRVSQESREVLNALPVDAIPEGQRIRIGVIGEIYVLMESSINLSIDELLNSLGCEVKHSLYLSEYIDHVIWPEAFARTSDKETLQKAEPYMEVGLGGHERHNLGSIIDFKEQGFDGVIHLMPFACLPELVTLSILPKISADYDIPVLSLSLDEQTGMANSLTRIEAFIDLIRSKQQRKPA